MMAFVDTSFFLAYLNGVDINNAAAKTAFERAIAHNVSFVTTNYVLVESFALIQNRLGIKALRDFQETIVPVLSVEFVDQATHNAGVSAVLTVARRGLSLVDCISFEIMRTLGVEAALAFDKHFEKQGFAQFVGE
jgi:predicted nucleic acid-binding protein